jgi:hypothetical protein
MAKKPPHLVQILFQAYLRGKSLLTTLMALIPCPACGRDVSVEAVACPQCGHPLAKSPPQSEASAVPARVENHKPSSAMTFTGIGCVTIIIGFIVLSAIGRSSSSSSSQDKPSGTTPRAAATSLTPPSPADKWSYRTDTDAMTSKESRYASIQSENTVDFDFPYSGPQHATLILREHPSYGRDILFTIEQGQFICPSYDGCNVSVRFDDNATQAWSASPPSDHSTTTLFLANYSSFVRKLRSAKAVRIQAGVYQEGQPVFEFDVSGYDHKRFTGTD